MNSFFKERYTCDICKKQFHYKNDLYSHQENNCDTLNEISIIQQQQNPRKNEMYSFCDEELDGSSSQLRNTSIASKRMMQDENLFDSFLCFEKNKEKLNDTMMEIPSNDIYKGRNKNYAPKSRGPMNDTMIEYNEKTVKKNQTSQREIYFQRKSNDSFDEYFCQKDDSNCVQFNSYSDVNSDLDSFYFLSFEDNQNRKNGKKVEENNSNNEKGLENIKEYFYNP